MDLDSTQSNPRSASSSSSPQLRRYSPPALTSKQLLCPASSLPPCLCDQTTGKDDLGPSRRDVATSAHAAATVMRGLRRRGLNITAAQLSMGPLQLEQPRNTMSGSQDSYTRRESPNLTPLFSSSQTKTEVVTDRLRHGGQTRKRAHHHGRLYRLPSRAAPGLHAAGASSSAVPVHCGRTRPAIAYLAGRRICAAGRCTICDGPVCVLRCSSDPGRANEEPVANRRLPLCAAAREDHIYREASGAYDAAAAHTTYNAADEPAVPGASAICDAASPGSSSSASARCPTSISAAAHGNAFPAAVASERRVAFGTDNIV